MKFIVKNESTRTHVLDRDLHHGQSAEYTPEDFAKICKGVAIAMQTMKQHLDNGQNTDTGGTVSVRSGTPDLRVYCIDTDDAKVELTPEDVRTFKVDAAVEVAPAAEPEGKK